MFLSVSNIKSTSVAELSINATTKQAVVRYVGNDRPYLYTGVDFNALYNIMFTQIDSIGQWVNQNLKNVANVECYAVWLDRTEILFNGGIRVPLFITIVCLLTMFDENDLYFWLNICHENLSYGVGQHTNYYYFLSQFN